MIASRSTLDASSSLAFVSTPSVEATMATWAIIALLLVVAALVIGGPS